MEKTEKPNWDKWRNMLEVVLWEAVALSLDVEPDYLDSRDEILSRHRQPKQYKDEKGFNDRYDVAESHMGIGKPLRPGSILPRAHRAGVSLAEFSAWAQSINWEIPQELADLAYEGQTTPTTNPYSDFPPDTKWEDMTFTFLSNEMVRVEAKGVTKKYLFSDLGFTDRRKGDTPDTRWATLSEFAKNNGEIGWSKETKINELTRKTLKAAVRDIRKKLRAFFNIGDDPFHFYRKTNSYKTKFTIKDNRYTDDIDHSDPEGFSMEEVENEFKDYQ